MIQHLSDTFRAIRRSPYQSLAAVMTLSQTFFLAYMFVLLMIGSELILRYFETQPQITAFFQPDIGDEQVSEAEQVIAEKPYVKSIKRITKDQALSIYREDNKDDAILLQLVTADILPASLEVSTKTIESLPQLEADLKELPGVDEVVFQKDVTDTLSKWTNSLRAGGSFLLILMGFTSAIQIMVMMSMRVSSKRQAIRTMQLIGASRWYIKAPFILEGAMYGILGAVIGWIGIFTMQMYLTPWLLNFLGDIPILPIPITFMAILLAAGTCVGTIIGGFSSLLSTQRFLH